jgi:hypothetical protein
MREITLNSYPYVVNEIIPNLFMGAAPPINVDYDKSFGCLVLCAAEYQPSSHCFPGLDVLNCPFTDSADPINASMSDLIDRTSRRVAEMVKSNEPVLVTCLAGLNRSGLVTALAMSKFLKHDINKTIGLIKSNRAPAALSNPYFVSLLKNGF